MLAGNLSAMQQAYTSDDLDWNDRQSRSSVEMNNPRARPALKDTKAEVAAYDVIFIGYPICGIRLRALPTHSLKAMT